MQAKATQLLYLRLKTILKESEKQLRNTQHDKPLLKIILPTKITKRSKCDSKNLVWKNIVEG